MNSTPLPIESGSTGEWKLRIGIFLAMCAAFSGWFAYDGLIGYPKKNLESIRQALPEKPEALQASPLVTEANVKSVVDRAATGAMTIDALKAALGKPVLDQPSEWTYVGANVVAIARMDDQKKLLNIRWHPVDDANRVDTPNYRVTNEQIDRLAPGMTDLEVSRFLGEPTKREPRRLWYAGPAMYASFDVYDTRTLTGKPLVRELEPNEGDIFIQKVLAVILAMLTVFVAVKWLRIVTLRVRVDDTGLTFRSRHIPWEAMTGLETDQYLDKGWVDLVYTQNGEEELQRLDSYHIHRFREVVQAICERKGFTLPTPPPSDPTDSDRHAEVV